MSARSLRQRPQRKTGESSTDAGNEADWSKRRSKKKGCYFGKNTPYDDYGFIRNNGLDVCDCMNSECEGCWDNCRNCGSTKCGPHCRVNRKFYYENIIYDGKDLTISNKYFPSKP
ncbi:hypothetical protein KR222_005661 [Zaprionus bogoriensis]|nr:hypothetical protein KR222_005661 [Zaprionus bogoriensis]